MHNYAQQKFTLALCAYLCTNLCSELGNELCKWHPVLRLILASFTPKLIQQAEFYMRQHNLLTQSWKIQSDIKVDPGVYNGARKLFGLPNEDFMSESNVKESIAKVMMMPVWIVDNLPCSTRSSINTVFHFWQVQI